MKSSVTRVFSVSAIVLTLSVSSSWASDTIIFDTMEDYVAPTKNNIRLPMTDDRVLQCLLSAKTLEYAASNTELIDSDHAKAVRAKNDAPKFEILLKNRMQTDLLFNRDIGKVKAEYEIFKSSEKGDQKRLFKMAKDINKSCGRRVKTMIPASMQRARNTAALMVPLSSEKAAMCSAAAMNDVTSLNDLVGIINQAAVWQTTYQFAKRREGHPEDQKVKHLALDDSRKMLKSLSADQALELHKTCQQNYKDAVFKYNLDKPNTSDFVFESSIEWDEAE